MKFSYKFPAVKGIQAGNIYYIAMVPLSLLDKLFPEEADIVLPEHRAQRQINESRIPIIKNYILANRNNYVFSALSASIDGDFIFDSNESEDTGILEIDMNSVFLINDGQHRKAAIKAALEEDSSLKDETISVVFFEDKGLNKSQQMFADLNKHAVKTSNSLATLYDYRDPLAVATRQIVDYIPFFKNFTDKERDILGKNSSNLFTLNTIYKANSRIVHKREYKEHDKDFLKSYWTSVCDNIPEWNEVLEKELTKKSLRENYITTLSITICSFGRLGRYYYLHKKNDMAKNLKKLNKINWLRSNEDWKNRMIRENGKIINSEKAEILTANKIKILIGIDLNKEEQKLEKTI